MRVHRLLLLPALLSLAGAVPPDLRRAPGESAGAFAARVLEQRKEALQVVETRWGDRAAIFADYAVVHSDPKGNRIETRELAVLTEQPGAVWRRIAVTRAEEEGGVAEIAAIGFANADRDADRELIVLIKWPQVHYDYSGAFYEVRLFDTPHPGVPHLAPLPKTSALFGGIGCECNSRDGGRQRYRFTTIAAIRQELTRRGY